MERDGALAAVPGARVNLDLVYKHGARGIIGESMK
jgi:hypothetical protein